MNLKERFGKRYRVSRDECGEEIIRLRGDKGFVCAYSDNTLAAYIQTRHPTKTLNRLRREVSSIEVVQKGDTELVVTCSMAVTDQFLKGVGAKTRAQRGPLSDESRRLLIEAGREYRFFSHATGL